MKSKLRLLTSAALFTLLPTGILFFNDLSFIYKTRLSALWISISMYSRLLVFPLCFCAALCFLLFSVFAVYKTRSGARDVLLCALTGLAAGALLAHFAPQALTLAEHALHVCPYVWSVPCMWGILLLIALASLLRQSRAPKA